MKTSMTGIKTIANNFDYYFYQPVVIAFTKFLNK